MSDTLTGRCQNHILVYVWDVPRPRRHQKFILLKSVLNLNLYKKKCMKLRPNLRPEAEY